MWKKTMVITTILVLMLSIAQTALATDVYIVKKGDTLWSISQKNGITVDDLKKENNIKNEKINVGQSIKIPNILPEYHKVGVGDTLWNISVKYGVSVAELKRVNNLKSDTIRIGQELYLKKGIDEIEEEKPSNNTTYHVVKKGDTLWSISVKYKTTVKQIIENNKLKSEVISIGQKLTINGSDIKEPGNDNAKEQKVTEAYTTANLNLREGKDTSSKIILTIPKSSKVKVLNNNGNWWEVEYNGKKGFSSSEYLNLNIDEQKKPTSKTIILDPGHGYTDPGAVNGMVKESTLTTQFTQKTKTELEKLGYKVLLTRNGENENCSGKGSSEDLRCRVDFAKKNNGDIFVSIHINSAVPQAKGTETYYHNSNSKELAETVHKSYQPAFNSTDRGVKTANFYVIKQIDIPSILLEIGFITNPDELKRLQNESIQDATAKAIAKGVDDYYKK